MMCVNAPRWRLWTWLGWMKPCSGGHRRPYSVSGDQWMYKWWPMTKFLHGYMFHVGYWDSIIGSFWCAYWKYKAILIIIILIFIVIAKILKIINLIFIIIIIILIITNIILMIITKILIITYIILMKITIILIIINMILMIIIIRLVIII